MIALSRPVRWVPQMFKRRWFVLAFLALAIFGAGVYAGLWSADQLTRKFSLLSRIERKASGYIRSAIATGYGETETVTTGRLRLEKRVVNVPLEVADNGGGLGPSPDGALLLIDRTGQIFHVSDGVTTKLAVETPDNNIGALEQQFSDGLFESASLRLKGFRYNDILAVESGDEIHLLVSFSEWLPDRVCVRNTLAGLVLPRATAVTQWQAAAADWRVVKHAAPCIPPRLKGGDAIEGIEAGGRLARLSETELIWSTGVYGRDDKYAGAPGDTYAQRDDSDYGKLLRINFRTGETVMVAKGLRNPQGLSIGSDGGIWVTDHGMAGGDELNHVTLAGPVPNFGHPVVSYGTHYNRRPVSRSGVHEGHDGYDLPVVSFVPSIGPGAALAVENFDAAWDGDVLIGDFSDALQRVHVVGGRAMVVEPVPTGVRTRDLEMTAAGEIAIWTDNLQIIYLKPSDRPDALGQISAKVERLEPAALRAATGNMLEACLQCHGFSPGDHRAGPSLHRICGRRLGDSTYPDYSGALATAGGRWSAERLAAFIEAPGKVAPGTSMAWEGSPDTDAVRRLAGIICSARD